MDRKRWLMRVLGLIGCGAIIGSAAYTVLHDSPLALCGSILFAFPSAFLLALSAPDVKDRRGY